MRVSELLALTPSDLEPYNQVLNITRAKGKKQRRVVVDPPMFAMLSTYIAETNTSEEQPIFGLSSVQVWNIVKKYGLMINVDIHPHTFRHKFCHTLGQVGVDVAGAAAVGPRQLEYHPIISATQGCRPERRVQSRGVFMIHF